MLCQHPGCLTELPPRKGRGRQTERCPEHVKARKAEQNKAKYERDKARILSEKPETIYEERIPQCCLDWRKAGRPNRKTCPQHKTWRAFIRQSRDFYRTSIRLNGYSTGQDYDTVVSLITSNRGVRVHADPDSWKPVTREDKAQDKALAEWIDKGMQDAAEMKEIYANQAARRLSHVGQHDAPPFAATAPPPPDIAYWQKVCADRRRWHKSAAFRYPPEMNRGGDWVAGI